MSETDKLKDAVKQYEKTVKEQQRKIKEAVDNVKTIRQVQTELPSRQY